MSCLGCQACEDGPVVTLHDGSVVCSACPSFRLECEARELNRLPIEERRERWKLIRDRRGDEAARELFEMMQKLETA